MKTALEKANKALDKLHQIIDRDEITLTGDQLQLLLWLNSLTTLRDIRPEPIKELEATMKVGLFLKDTNLDNL